MSVISPVMDVLSTAPSQLESRLMLATQPDLKGDLIALKTTLEIRPGDALVEVFITKVPPKSANSILSSVRTLYANTASLDLQHLRKFAKASVVPESVLAAFGEPTRDFSIEPTASLYLLVGPTKGVTVDALAIHLAGLLPDGVDRNDVLIWKTVVPLLAPTSTDQALGWSASYWPTVYKKSNPFGPHPSIIERATSDIADDAPRFLSMAAKVAQISKKEGMGEPIGALVVDRSGGVPKIVSLAADARWKGQSRDGPGNIMAHATLRAIGMVAQKLKRTGDKYAARRDPIRDEHERQIFNDFPLLGLEKEVADADNISMDGYLCHGLEIYLTHEPCIMCSMSILHSRFAKVVFGQRMPSTGGISSESDDGADLDGNISCDGLGYGLFWRKELNWSLLGWEYKQEEVDPASILDPMTHA